MPLDGTRKVLSLAMVDPDLQTRKIFADWVRRTAGVRCAGVYVGGGKTLADLRLKKPQVVIVETGNLGGNFLGRLKMILPETCFYIYADKPNPEDVFQGMAAGAAGYFLKRIPLPIILKAIQKNYSGNLPAREVAAMKVLEHFEVWVADPETASFPQRQQEVLDFLVQGFNNKEIAQVLKLSLRTVDTHVRRLFLKLGVRSRAQAVARCIQSRQASLKVAGGPGFADFSQATSPVDVASSRTINRV